uniref:hypothetical protein n=1 Tax=Caldalkalibacillus salinus TaxID=2803787 RepID=UPI001922D368
MLKQWIQRLKHRWENEVQETSQEESLYRASKLGTLNHHQQNIKSEHDAKRVEGRVAYVYSHQRVTENVDMTEVQQRIEEQRQKEGQRWASHNPYMAVKDKADRHEEMEIKGQEDVTQEEDPTDVVGTDFPADWNKERVFFQGHLQKSTPVPSPVRGFHQSRQDHQPNKSEKENENKNENENENKNKEHSQPPLLSQSPSHSPSQSDQPLETLSSIRLATASKQPRHDETMPQYESGDTEERLVNGDVQPELQ